MKKKTSSFKVIYTIGALLVGGFLFNSFLNNDQKETTKSFSKATTSLSAFPIQVPEVKFGFALDTFHVFQDTIQNNQFLAELLLPHKVNYQDIDQLARNVQDTFSVTKLRADKEYTILSRDTAKGADYFIYEPDVYSYVVYDLKNELDASVYYREKETTIKQAAGTIESSLWVTMQRNGYPIDLIDKMEGVLQWSLDFYHIQNGDKFKLIYEENTIDGKYAGIGKVLGAYFKNYDNEYYGIYFESDKLKGYYDEEGRPMKSPFLKSPVKYSRISSSFNLRRFHPVLKRVKPHLGTDYAAARGTPIMSVGNGVVERAGYTRGNGNYVKIKHDKTYSTQYLHMSKFAKGIRGGVQVKQGQVIGYVGSTGLATGPHVCFRFWKNGRQVNHLRLKLPNPEPMPEALKPLYLPVRDEMVERLEGIEYPAVLLNEVEEEPKVL
ncbi:MAG: peptidoglycan DD-metalloendopeptidase family protein [Bacteroidota bacterium]